MDAKNSNRLLVDTDILIDSLRSYKNSIDFFNQNPPATLYISSISSMEIIQGCRNKSQLIEIKKMLNEPKIVYVSKEISITAIELMEKYSLSHGLSIPDALIAATASYFGHILVSRNIKHYSFISDLEYIKPYD